MAKKKNKKKKIEQVKILDLAVVPVQLAIGVEALGLIAAV